MIKLTISSSEALKVDALCARILGDIGSIHARITPLQEDGRAAPIPPELAGLRRYIREISDAVRDADPSVFFK